MGFKVVIPARYASTRLPAKPLVDLGGRPMIQWVIDAACRSAAEEVLVATDDARIAAVACDPRTPSRSLAVLTRVDLQRYQADLVAQRKPNGTPYSAGFHVNRLSALKSFFGFLLRRQIVLLDPTAGLERPRLEIRLPRAILTPREARRIVEAPRARSPLALRDRAILETMYSAGLRVPRELRMESLEQLIGFVSRIGCDALADLQGVSPARAHQVPAGAVVAAATLRAVAVPCVRICPWALREGVILRRLDSMGGA